MPHFECGAFNHSATSPEGAKSGESLRGRGRVIGEDGHPDKARGTRLAKRLRGRNKVGPPYAIKTGGPVPSHCNARPEKRRLCRTR
jgi:hypothetical protein